MRFAVLLALFLPTLSWAHEWEVPDLSKIGRGQSIPTEVLTTIRSSSREQAVWEAARYLNAFTKKTGKEGCGLIEEHSGGFFEIVLTTNYSQIACRTDRAPRAGYSTNGETIHSHPEKTEVRANPVDAVWGNTRRGRLLMLAPDNFSKRDRTNGSGYLVAMGRLLYQNEQGDRLIGDLAPALASR